MIKSVFAKLDAMTHEVVYFGKTVMAPTIGWGRRVAELMDLIHIDVVNNKIYHKATDTLCG
jgi:hypothetical protein